MLILIVLLLFFFILSRLPFSPLPLKRPVGANLVPRLHVRRIVQRGQRVVRQGVARLGQGEAALEEREEEEELMESRKLQSAGGSARKGRELAETSNKEHWKEHKDEFILLGR